MVKPVTKRRRHIKPFSHTAGVSPGTMAIVDTAATATEMLSTKPVFGVPEGIWCWVAYLAACITPLVGLTLGLLFVGTKEKTARRFGCTCVLLAFLGYLAWDGMGWYDKFNMNSDEDDKYTESYY